MDGVVTGGNRRIDRVLDEAFLAGLGERPLTEVRRLRDEADQEETDLSYLRRLLQARLDLVTAEIARRADGAAAPTDVVAFVTAILAEGDRAPARGSGRHALSEPTRAGESRRSAEQLVSDALLTDLVNVSDAVLGDAHEVLGRAESLVSQQRSAVQGVLDTVNAEIARRYRDGEASVDTLLADATATD
ncbi:MAG TPA: aerial mycelium formation protein [Mycobacteriales bacterium]